MFGVGEPPPDSEPDGCGESMLGEPDGVPSDPSLDGDPDGDSGEPDCDCGDWGEDESLASVGSGGGAWDGGVFWKASTAISRAIAASSSANNHDTSVETQPARSWRPGQGSGHSRVVPGVVLPIQCSW